MIVRNHTNRNFTIIRNEVINRKDMGMAAKGLYTFLISKPDGWHISINGLCSQIKEGRDAVSSMLKELEALGYYKKIRQNKKDGTFFWTSIFSDVPLSDDNNEGEDAPITPVDDPHTGNPHMGNPPQVNTDLVRTDKINTDNTIANAIGANAPKRIKSDINEALKYWEVATDLPITSRLTLNRYACSNLLKKYGSTELYKLIDIVSKAQSDRYGPRIGDFCSLQTKMADLLVWRKQNLKQSNLYGNTKPNDTVNKNRPPLSQLTKEELASRRNKINEIKQKFFESRCVSKLVSTST